MIAETLPSGVQVITPLSVLNSWLLEPRDVCVLTKHDKAGRMFVDAWKVLNGRKGTTAKVDSSTFDICDPLSNTTLRFHSDNTITEQAFEWMFKDPVLIRDTTSVLTRDELRLLNDLKYTITFYHCRIRFHERRNVQP